VKNIILPFQTNNEFRFLILDFVKYSDKKYWNINTTEGTKNRFFCKISDLSTLYLSQIVSDIANYYYKELGIFEDIFGNFVGVNKEGGNVHIHTDPPNQNGWFHTRLNCLIQKPEFGGMPIIDNCEYNIDEGQVWFNNATLWQHGSTVVRGQKDRVVLSLGAYISPQDYERINGVILNNQ
jgi:hypothetical protein